MRDEYRADRSGNGDDSQISLANALLQAQPITDFSHLADILRFGAILGHDGLGDKLIDLFELALRPSPSLQLL